MSWLHGLYVKARDFSWEYCGREYIINWPWFWTLVALVLLGSVAEYFG